MKEDVNTEKYLILFSFTVNFHFGKLWMHDYKTHDNYINCIKTINLLNYVVCDTGSIADEWPLLYIKIIRQI